MKTKVFLIMMLLFLDVVGSNPSLMAQEKDQDAQERLITARDYCLFLNEGATEALGSLSQDSGSLLQQEGTYPIFRSGLPGNYHYEVAAEEAVAPISLVNREEMALYGTWKSKATKTLVCVSCTNSSSIDRALKSNHVTFCFVDQEIKAYQASGEEMFCSSILDDLLEGVFLIAGAGNVITRQPRADVFNESTRSTHDAEQQVTAEERQQIDDVIKNSSFARPKQNEVLDTNQQLHDSWGREIDDQDQGHYGAVNKLWNEYAKKWNTWIVARKNLKRTQERLAAVQQESARVEKALSAEDLSQTKMGKFIAFCNDITPVAEYLPAIHGFNPIALASQGASLIATRMQEGMVQMMKQGAKEAIEKATQEMSAAETEAHAVLRGILGQDPQQTEEIARAQEAEKVMKAAEALQRSFPASRFSKESWKKAMHTYDQEVFTQGIHAIERLAPLKHSYQQVEKRRQEQEEAQEKITIASQWRLQARKVLDSVIADCPLPEEGRSLRDKQFFLSKRKAILEASRYHEKAEQVEEELERRLQKMKFFAPQLEKKAIKLYEEYQSAQEALALELERAKARAEAYHVAWRKEWPEEALREEMTLGETIWKKALQHQEEEKWEVAHKQALILNELQKHLPHLCSAQEKEEWNKREKITHAKIAFFKLQRSDFSFFKEVLMNESSLESSPIQENIQQVSNLAKLLEPCSQEAAKVFRLVAKTLSSIENGAKVAGWHATINERVEKIQTATQKLTGSLWEEEAHWINNLAEQMGVAFVPTIREESKSAPSESRLPVPGKLLKSGSFYGAFLELSSRGVQIRYANAPQEISEKKELVELAKLKKTSKVLQQKIKQLRGQVSYQAAERSKIEALQQKSLAKIAEIATKSEEQAKLFAAREAELMRRAEALKDESEVVRQEKEAELKRLQEALKQEREAFEAAQEAKLTAVLISLDQQTKALKAQEEELLLSEKTLEEVIEQYHQEIEQLQQELCKAKEQAEEANVARMTAEGRAADERARALQAERHIAQLEEQLQTALKEKEAAEKEAVNALQKEIEAEKESLKAAEHLQRVRALFQKRMEIREKEFSIENSLKELPHGETIFVYDFATQTEANWNEVIKISIALESAWNEVLEAYEQLLEEHALDISQEERKLIEEKIEEAESQERMWKERGSISKVRKSFAKIKVLWDEFVPTVNTLREELQEQKFQAVTTAARALAAAADLAAKNATNHAAASASTSTIHATESLTAVATVMKDVFEGITDTTVAQRAIDRAARAVRATVGSIWEKEAAWAVTTIREMAPFTEAAAGFHALQEKRVKELKEAQELVAKELQEARDALEAGECASKEGELLFAQATAIKIEEEWFHAAENSAVLEANWNKLVKMSTGLELLWHRMIESYQFLLLTHTAMLSEEEKEKISLEIKKSQAEKKNWGEKIIFAKAKAAFVHAKVIWENFSSAATTFTQEPNQSNLDAARIAATAAVNAAADAARIVGHTDDVGYAAADAARTAARATEDTIRTATDGTDVLRAVPYAAIAATAARGAVDTAVALRGTVWEEEGKWASVAAREAADFAGAVVEFFHKEVSKKSLFRGWFK